MQKIFLGLIYFVFLAQGSVCQAEEKTAEELCRLRNSSYCEVSGLKFYIDDVCPKGARILRPHGKERCEDFLPRDNIVVKPQSAVIAVSQPVVAQQASMGNLPAKATEEEEAADAWWPLLLLAALQAARQAAILPQ